MKVIGTVHAFGQELLLLETAYANGAVGLVLHTQDGEPWTTLTTNIPGTVLADDEVLIKTYSENEELRQPALDTGLFLDTGRRVQAGFAEAEVWRRVLLH